MAAVIVHKPKTLGEFVSVVEALQRPVSGPLWFRGSSSLSHRLIPTLYRHPTKVAVADLLALEKDLLARFRQRSLPFHSRAIGDDWDALFFMQHYGVPTRLLDWTENPLTALHFSLMSAPTSKDAKGKVSYPGSALVWVLDPSAWNEVALKRLSYSGGPAVPGDQALKGYIEDVSSERPVALYGAHNSSRIVAQQGVFTIFGNDKTPMEALVKKGAFPVGCLQAVQLVPSVIGPVRAALLRQGVTESMIFPDLEGLAREMKRQYGFTY